MLQARAQAGSDPDELARVADLATDADALPFAASTLEEAIVHGAPDSVSIRLAILWIRLGRLVDAERILRERSAADPSGYALLQLGNALRYQGALQEAHACFESASAQATSRKDGALAIAGSCGLGELTLDEARPKEAVAHFGKALGLTELAYGDAITVAPLAGLAEAHARWRAPQKAVELAQRALDRASRAGDRAGAARALLAAAAAEDRLGQRDDELLDKQFAQPADEQVQDRREQHLVAAERAALAAPHVPLWIRARARRVTDAEHGRDEILRREGLTLARWAGMSPEAAVLARKESQ